MGIQAQPTGLVIPFPDAAIRAMRTHRLGDGPRGEILLFTGIRYERQIDREPEPPASDETGNRARRRRH